MGYMIDGTQAEYVRTPFADTSLYVLPEGLNEDVAVYFLMLYLQLMKLVFKMGILSLVIQWLLLVPALLV